MQNCPDRQFWIDVTPNNMVYFLPFFAKLDKHTLKKVTYKYQKEPKTAKILKKFQQSYPKSILGSVLVPKKF